jgi:hypothetical protein
VAVQLLDLVDAGPQRVAGVRKRPRQRADLVGPIHVERRFQVTLSKVAGVVGQRPERGRGVPTDRDPDDAEGQERDQHHRADPVSDCGDHREGLRAFDVGEDDPVVGADRRVPDQTTVLPRDDPGFAGEGVRDRSIRVRAGQGRVVRRGDRAPVRGHHVGPPAVDRLAEVVDLAGRVDHEHDDPFLVGHLRQHGHDREIDDGDVERLRDVHLVRTVEALLYLRHERFVHLGRTLADELVRARAGDDLLLFLTDHVDGDHLVGDVPALDEPTQLGVDLRVIFGLERRQLRDGPDLSLVALHPLVHLVALDGRRRFEVRARVLPDLRGRLRVHCETQYQ